jgi:FecR protein
MISSIRYAGKVRHTWFSLLCLLLVNAPPALYLAAYADNQDNDQQDSADSAMITEAKGTVLKRERPELPSSIPTPASVGEHLSDGMQVGTGANSYAELKWPDVVARAWANSTYSLSPGHRLVYLQDGQMLFNLDKHRKNKSEYVLWTNLLQARIHGTTVFVQSTGNISRITVLEGTIDVLNRADKSTVRLQPGVVYEVTDNTVNANSNADLTPITSGNAIPVFVTNKSLVSLYQANVNNLYKHMPLITSFSNPLPSLPLVNEASDKLASLTSSLTNDLGNLTGDVGKLTGELGKLTGTALQPVLNLLHGSASILRVPIGVDYAVGPLVGSAVKLPADSFSFFPPIGVISNPSSAKNGGSPLAETTRLLDRTGVMPLAQSGNTAGLLTNGLMGITPLPITGNTSSGMPGVAGITAFTGTSGLTGVTGLTGASGISPNLGGMSLGGVQVVPLGAIVQTVTGATSTATAGVTAATGGASSPLNSLIGPGGLVTKTTGGVVGGVNSVLGGLHL